MALSPPSSSSSRLTKIFWPRRPLHSRAPEAATPRADPAPHQPAPPTTSAQQPNPRTPPAAAGMPMYIRSAARPLKARRRRTAALLLVAINAHRCDSTIYGSASLATRGARGAAAAAGAAPRPPHSPVRQPLCKKNVRPPSRKALHAAVERPPRLRAQKAPAVQ
jgi:hypothetical protein